MSIGGGKGGSSPSAPNYSKLAEQTAKSNYDYGLKGLDQNRITQNNPYGSIGFSKGADGTWSMNTNLNPEQQQIFNNNQQFGIGASGDANSGLQAANGLFSNPTLNMNNLPAAQINPGQTAQDAIMARLSPEFDRESAQNETQLRNQGVMPGSEAYNNSMDQLGRQHNDAMSQAALQGINVGQQARMQGIAEQQAQFNTPLDVLGKLNTVGQAQVPSYQSFPLLNQTNGVDYSGAGANQYNAKLNASNAGNASSNQMMGGLFNLGASMLSR